ncbi:coiled-coil domain-containing protein 115 [Kryptolebias marmoratus]|uniref:Vacuolar ATPase assembly protein VMA22 n=1 Tax=Kryptolebias marmoratus TaxID=37003 RepID=A0A3Q3BEN6_KRYMA|nr:coiled-coil domain-containing protein 115 [Kryptolebias marmoratus]
MGVSEGEESCLLLDEKLLHFMDQLELLEKKRTSLNSLIEQGWFSMTKARYSMGNKLVSALQYANEMDPLVCVHVRTLDSGEVVFCTEKSAHKCSEESTKDHTCVENVGPQEEGIRHRKKKKNITEKKPGEDASGERSPDDNVVRKGDRDPLQDPLKWFGILVPQPLKQAQSSFKQAIELSAEIAALQIAVLNTQEELKNSLTNKVTSGEEFKGSAGEGGDPKESTGSKQEDTKGPSLIGSTDNGV